MGLRPRHDCDWMWVGMGKAAAWGCSLATHSMSGADLVKYAPHICVLKCFGCAVRGLQNDIVIEPLFAISDGHGST